MIILNFKYALEGKAIFSKGKRGVFLKKKVMKTQKNILSFVCFNRFAITIGITIVLSKENLQWANICIHLYSHLIVFSVTTPAAPLQTPYSGVIIPLWPISMNFVQIIMRFFAL